MSESSLRWLLVGTGDIVRKRVGAALSESPGSCIAAVCGRRRETAEQVARIFGAAQSFDDLPRALSEASADAVYVATPVATHVEIARAALLAGKHVLIEKPLGVDAAECAPLVELAARSGLTAGCAYYRRCLPRFAHAVEVIKAGRIGEPLLVRMSYISWYAPQESAWRVETNDGGGGPAADVGCHMFDLLSALIGRPRRIFVTASRRIHSYAANDSCAIAGEWANGVAVLANFHWSSKAWQHEMEITGPEGRLKWSPFDSGPVIVECGREVEQVFLPAPANVHQPLVEDFVTAVREKRPVAVPLDEARQTSAVLDAIRFSFDSGLPVAL